MRQLTPHPTLGHGRAKGALRVPRGKAPRRKGAPRWRRPSLVFLTTALAMSAVVGASHWIFRSNFVEMGLADAQRILITASVRAGFTVKEVLVDGRKRSPRSDLLDAIGFQIGTPMLNIRPATVRARIEALPWVRSAVVSKRLPATIHVRLLERRPMALWQRGRQLALVDGEGHVITNKRLHRFANLLVVVGGNAPKHVPELIAMLKTEPALEHRVRAAVRVGGRRWNLKLDNGIDVRLPERDATVAWSRLAVLERRRQLLRRDITTIDLRQADQLVVHPRWPILHPQPIEGEST